MPRTVAVATAEPVPEPDDELPVILGALGNAGIDARRVAWTDGDADWASFDGVLIRSTWDYFDRRDEFVAWAERVDAVTKLWNPAPLIAWNSHKRYLEQLEDSGVPVVDTVWGDAGGTLDLRQALADRGWSDAVFKPAIAGGADGLVRVRSPEEAEAAQPELDRQLAAGDVLVQPFLPSIVEEGELSLLFFGGELSHTLRKRAKSGDIRVQPVHGGTWAREEPSDEARAVADATFAALDHEWLYARVDLVRALDGTLRLIELEVIEPYLFLADEPEAAGRLARAVERAL
jgi:glutathione synthase/RimK-type ligase-like ATP-grasp enzyme